MADAVKPADAIRGEGILVRGLESGEAFAREEYPGRVTLQVGNGCEDGMVRFEPDQALVLGTSLMLWAESYG